MLKDDRNVTIEMKKDDENSAAKVPTPEEEGKVGEIHSTPIDEEQESPMIPKFDFDFNEKQPVAQSKP